MWLNLEILQRIRAAVFFFENKNQRHVGEHLKKMTPNSDLQFINKESGNSMTTAKYQSARLLPHWRQSKVDPREMLQDESTFVRITISCP